jgi:membrane associated rhomboid family serine protease
MPDVTKNLLILNVLFFLVKYVLESQGVNASQLLGMHYPASELFEPYQVVTHFFMHGNLFHILFNMIGLVVIGSHLERVWGKKRFFIFYFVTALGAMLLHIIVQGVEIYQITGELFPEIYFGTNDYGNVYAFQYAQDGSTLVAEWMQQAGSIMYIPVVGASGAIYGLLMAFALLFPNTEFMLLFPPIPIKAKWLALILGGIALYSGFERSGDSVAHFAHLGGMLFGFIMIKIWQRNKNTFY